MRSEAFLEDEIAGASDADLSPLARLKADLWRQAHWWLAQIIAVFGEPVEIAAKGLPRALHRKLTSWLPGVEMLVRRLVAAEALKLAVVSHPSKSKTPRELPAWDDAEPQTWRPSFTYWRNAPQPNPEKAQTLSSASPAKGEEQSAQRMNWSSGPIQATNARSANEGQAQPLHMSRWQARWNPEPKPTEAKPYDHFTPHGGASTDMTAPQRDHPHAALLPPRGSTNFAERYPFGHAPIVFASSAPLPEPPKIFEARGLARRILSLARTMEDPLGAARRLAFRLARWGEAEAAKLREPPEIPDNTPAYEAVRQTHDLNEAKKPPPPPPP